MRSLARAYDRLIMALAILAGAMLAGVFVMIVYDVTVRTLGYQPPFFTSALSEYAMLYMTLLAAPWVVRVRGHVYVESVTSMLRERTRHVIQKGVYVLCLVICLGLAYYGTRAGVEFLIRGDDDVRSIVIPRWVLYLPMPIGFVLSAVEFGRYLLGFDSMYEGRRGAGTEGI